jgi:DNA-binding transcriptional LysR family regulator
LIIRACRGAGFDPDVAMVFPTDDYTAIQGLVAAGIGVTLLPRLALAYPRDDIAVRALDGATPYRTVMAAYLADARSPLVEAVLDALTRAASAEE